MPFNRNKDRLYVALYVRGGRPSIPGLEDRYHWALLVGPKDEPRGTEGTLHHIKESISESPNHEHLWQYQDRSPIPTHSLLVRVVVGKVVDNDRLRSILKQIPLRPEETGWNCISWVQEAFETVTSDKTAIGTSVTGWESARDRVMWYVNRKKAAHRFDGQAPLGRYDQSKTATWDMLEDRELSS